MKKINVGILFGGKSSEHEVSLQSAKNVIAAIDKEKYNTVLIGIDKTGRWYLNENSRFLLNSHDPKRIALEKSKKDVVILPGDSNHELLSVGGGNVLSQLDVVFPVLHGSYGEDGTVQGLLKLPASPFGRGRGLGSAVGMGRTAKRLLRDVWKSHCTFSWLFNMARKKSNLK